MGKLMLLLACTASMFSEAALAETAQSTEDALSQCVVLRTTGADRILTARWLFGVMSKSPQIADLSAVSAKQSQEANQAFAKLLTRLVTKDCINEVRPLAADDINDAFAQVGRALGRVAMTELMAGKEVDHELGAYTEFLSEGDFKPLADSLPKKSK